MLMCSWLLCRLEKDQGIVLRFVVGSVPDPLQEAELEAEAQKYGDILRLPLQVTVKSVCKKPTLQSAKTVTAQAFITSCHH